MDWMPGDCPSWALSCPLARRSDAVNVAVAGWGLFDGDEMVGEMILLLGWVDGYLCG